MPEVTREHLLAAIRSGRRFDGEKFDEKKPEAQWLLPFQAPYQRASFDAARSDPQSPVSASPGKGPFISVDAFEKKAIAARERAIGIQKRGSKSWPTLKTSVLIDALAEATRDLSDTNASRNKPIEDFNVLNGLQIYGVDIVPDHEFRNGSLNLVNVSFPFSVRLICCVIRAPIALSNVHLITLDLSGSALVGLDAKFLHARGSVRMRRTYALGPIDFAGTEVHGYFDATDLVIHPFGALPADQAVDGDSGVLSLNQASVDNEMWFNRAEIWGGLSMRGLTTKRSIYLNEARVFSPLAVLERLFQNAAGISPALAIDPGGSKSSHYVTEVAKLRSKNATIFERKAPVGEAVKQCALALFLCENLRVRTSAVRADGIRVGGSIFAKDMECRGRLRMKYAHVAGGLSMQGSSFGSAEVQRRTFDAWEVDAENREANDHYNLRLDTYNTLVKKDDLAFDRLALGSDDYALDLSESEFGGAVRLGLFKRDMERDEGRHTSIDGIVAIKRARIGGELVFGRTQFEWTVRVPRVHYGPDRPFGSREELSKDRRDERSKSGSIFAVRAQGITTGDDVSFLDSTGVIGADFRNATIGGNLSFFDELLPTDCDAFLAVTHASGGLRGRISIEGARIAGDCNLIFDPEEGPTIDAEKATIQRSLQIASPPVLIEASSALAKVEPSLAGQAVIPFSASDFIEAVRQSNDDWENARDAAARAPAEWKKYESKRRKLPKIDLGNARSTLLQHPFPAWPRAGRLQISGFRYERALTFGPLGPHPISRKPLSEIRIRNRDVAITGIMSCAAACSLYIGMYYERFSALDFGRTEIMLLGLLLGSAAIVRLISVTRPNSDNTKPMAVDYLKRQVISRNAYRTATSATRLWHYFFHFKIAPDTSYNLRGHVYNSLEPYHIAAAALREEGRWTSANIVEQTRQQERISHLSWRNNPFHKALFHTIGVINQFGFSISRPVFIMLLTICLGSMLAYNANANGAIKPKAFNVVARGPDTPLVCAAPTRPELTRQSSIDWIMSQKRAVEATRTGSNSTAAPQPAPAPGFSPLLFAVDKVVPVLDLGQDQDWEVDKTMPFTDVWLLSVLSYSFAFAILKTIGLTIVTLLFIALSTRVGSIFGRYKE